MTRLPPRPTLRVWRSVIVALGLGAAGGAVFAWIDLPLPWMLGAMTTCLVAAIAGLPLLVPSPLRQVNVTVLGLMLGSAFTPDLIERVDQWVVSLLGLTVYLAATAAAAMVFLRRIGGYDRATAFFSAIPGGLSEMVLVGSAMGGDLRRISLTHGTRILLVVMILPFWFRYGQPGLEAAVAGDAVPLAGLTPTDVAVLTACGAVGYVAARAIRLPAFAMTGPLLASAIAHVAGWTESQPPAELLAVAQVVVGAAVGSRFAGVPAAELRRSFALAVGVTVIMVAVTVAMSVLLLGLVDTEFAPLVLSYAPGGVAEMTLVALSLDMDVAFVSTHHLVRISLVVVAAPLAFRLLFGRRAAASGAGR